VLTPHLCPQISRAPAAAAIDAPAVPIGELPLEERQRLAEQWGYKTIGAELPEGVSLTDIVKSMPQEVGMACMHPAVLHGVVRLPLFDPSLLLPIFVYGR
jgi:omega-6 fatty acid desaturase (delta-12 desaturase)